MTDQQRRDNLTGPWEIIFYGGWYVTTFAQDALSYACVTEANALDKAERLNKLHAERGEPCEAKST